MTIRKLNGGCEDVYWSTIDAALNNLAQLADEVALGKIPYIVRMANRVRNHAQNARTLNHDQRNGKYNGSADDSILALTDAVSYMLRDKDFSAACGPDFEKVLRGQVETVRGAVLARSMSHNHERHETQHARRAA